MQSQQQGVFEELKGKRKYQKRERISLFKVTCLVPLAPKSYHTVSSHLLRALVVWFAQTKVYRNARRGVSFALSTFNVYIIPSQRFPILLIWWRAPKSPRLNTLELSLTLSYPFITASLYLPSFISSTFAMSGFGLPLLQFMGISLVQPQLVHSLMSTPPHPIAFPSRRVYPKHNIGLPVSKLTSSLFTQQ